MEELFRFYAIRAPDPLAPEQVFSLDTGSVYQSLLDSMPSLERASAHAEESLAHQTEALAHSGLKEPRVRGLVSWLSLSAPGVAAVKSTRAPARKSRISSV